MKKEVIVTVTIVGDEDETCESCDADIRKMAYSEVFKVEDTRNFISNIRGEVRNVHRYYKQLEAD